jgi:hypothetical protein
MVVMMEEAYLVLQLASMKHSDESHHELEDNICLRKQKGLHGTHCLDKTTCNLMLAAEASVQ